MDVNDVQILPGDCLLYSGSSPWSWVIKVKTWSDVSHSEVALNENYAITSRETSGVNLYPLTRRNLYAVMRPISERADGRHAVDFGAAMAWFATVKGQGYGYWQALRFFRLGKEDLKRMMCSPCCTRFYRAGGFHPFACGYDASLVAPRDFLTSPRFTEIWRAA